jgi:hypothetical protein
MGGCSLKSININDAEQETFWWYLVVIVYIVSALPIILWGIAVIQGVQVFGNR